MVACFIALPDALAALAGSVSFAEIVDLPVWSATDGVQRFDLVHAFTRSRVEIETCLPKLQDALKRDGMIWVSWPKKASKVPTDVTEDAVREAALGLDLVDVKVAAVDAVWSGLKLVIRKDRR